MAGVGTQLLVWFLILGLSLAAAAAGIPEVGEDLEGDQYRDPVSIHDRVQQLVGLKRRGLSWQQSPPPRAPSCSRNASICSDPSYKTDGPKCCGAKCTDVQTDSHNCGKCHVWCHYGKTCCKGHCVDLNNDPKNCGKCGHKCSADESCSWGLCDYSGARL